MIDVTDLTKSYGPIEALGGVTFHVAPGEIVGLLGPNGAGKTTTIKILTGYLQPDDGTVTVNGLDVLTHTREVQAHIGYLPESAPLYPELSVQAYLKMMAELRQMPEDEQLARLSEAITATGLADHLIRPIGHLSKGFRQRVGLAQAILHQPRLLILDEPTLGLDPTQVVEVRRLIRRLTEHSTILFSTHILSEVEALCDRVIILMNGQIRADARLSELAATPDAVLVLDSTPVKVLPSASEGAAGDQVERALRTLSGVRGVERIRTPDGYPAYRVLGSASPPRSGGGSDSQPSDLCPAIYNLAREEGWPLRELRRDVRTLETVFNELAMAA
jgi:ABC-2 type transport system ATP-binding protein